MKSVLLLISFLVGVAGYSQQGTPAFSTESFYLSLADGKEDRLDEQLALLGKTSISQKQAYEGTLWMRKAGVASGALNKLKLFKKGKILLESAIDKDADNPEYRFLRLLIQENAPSIVNYSSDIDTDVELVRKGYKKLSPQTQAAIVTFAKKSKALKPDYL